MPPLILHNVPDDELYVGEDGIQRPYAMLFPGVDNPSTLRSRRAVAETGSFGKSTRRSRSRTNTPGPPKQADPTIEAAEKIFGAFVTSAAENPSRKSKNLTSSISAPNNLSSAAPLGLSDGNSEPSKRYIHKEPTEVILRGFKPSHQYAAIREFEAIAGRICEDYPRDPPLAERRYKSDLRDPAVLRQTALTPAEKAKALRFAGGEHWIKITFESAEAAEIAIENSPQTVFGYLVYAEVYRGVPPTDIGEHPAGGVGNSNGGNGGNTERRTPRPERFSRSGGNGGSLPRGFGTSLSPGSNSSTQTLDTGTLSSATLTTPFNPAASTTSFSNPNPSSSSSQDFCALIPTAKKIRLLPADQALLPQQSYSQRILSKIPIIKWLSADIIGNQVPKTESGEFDWGKASLYWKVLWWVDGVTGWFDLGGEKEE